MADEKLNTGPEVQKIEEAPAPAVADPAHGEAPVPEHPPEQAGPADPGDVVISAEQIDALMAEKRQAAGPRWKRQRHPVNRKLGLLRRSVLPLKARKPKSRAGAVPPKSDKTERTGPEAEKAPKKAGPRKGRPSKADKAAPDKAQPSQRDKLSEVAGKLPKLLFPRMPERIRRKGGRSPGAGCDGATAPPRLLRRESWSI